VRLKETLFKGESIDLRENFRRRKRSPIFRKVTLAGNQGVEPTKPRASAETGCWGSYRYFERIGLSRKTHREGAGDKRRRKNLSGGKENVRPKSILHGRKGLAR